MLFFLCCFPVWENRQVFIHSSTVTNNISLLDLKWVILTLWLFWFSLLISSFCHQIPPNAYSWCTFFFFLESLLNTFWGNSGSQQNDTDPSPWAGVVAIMFPSVLWQCWLPHPKCWEVLLNISSVWLIMECVLLPVLILQAAESTDYKNT